MARTATITFEGKELVCPVVEGSEGELGIDIAKLRDATGLITLDPSLGNSGSCESKITYIDGDKGILRYRGIPIEQFATVPHPRFVEVAWLLIYGRLPKKQELGQFSRLLTEHEALHEEFRHHFQGFPTNAHPMAILSAMFNTLSCFHSEYMVLKDEKAFTEAAAMLISKVRTIAAYSYRISRGLPRMYPDPKMRYCANFMHMMFSMPYDRYELDPEVEDALNLILILHADHEQNCSTSTVRVVGSSQSNLFASCAAGVCALWGPLHGGANSAVLEMLDRIHRGGVTAEECVKMAKDKTSNFKLMGFGHRIYKNFDPRATILKNCADKVLAKLSRNNPLLDLARRLEDLALNDPYFIERKLYPNVDFYSGIILRAIGIPDNMFTVMFSMGRLPGWIAHWKEQHDQANTKICRPRQIYTGPTVTNYTPIEQRG